MTDKHLGIRPSAVEQAKFEYSPLDNFFNKRLKEEDKKEWYLKRLKSIEDKDEELLKASSAANKVSTGAKNEGNFNYDSKYALYEFNKKFENWKEYRH